MPTPFKTGLPFNAAPGSANQSGACRSSIRYCRLEQLNNWGDAVKYHLMSVATLIGAAIFSMVGLAGASVVFLACGVALETIFWTRMVRSRRRRLA